MRLKIGWNSYLVKMNRTIARMQERWRPGYFLWQILIFFSFAFMSNDEPRRRETCIYVRECVPLCRTVNHHKLYVFSVRIWMFWCNQSSDMQSNNETHSKMKCKRMETITTGQICCCKRKANTKKNEKCVQTQLEDTTREREGGERICGNEFKLFDT